jgi:proline racemase
LLEATTVGPYPAVIPTITGQAWIYGLSTYLVDPSDPFQEGFTIGDIWGGVD